MVTGRVICSRWERDLARRLQSWRDTAARSAYNRQLHDECRACPSDPLLQVIPNAASWPHWMRHELRDRLFELRSDEFFLVLRQPFDGETSLGDHYRQHDGGGHLRRDSRAQASALRIVDDHMTHFDTWLRERVTMLREWEDRVFQRVARQYPARTRCPTSPPIGSMSSTTGSHPTPRSPLRSVGSA